MSALLWVNLISVLNLPPLKKKQTLINAVKDLAYMCSVKGFRRDIVTCFYVLLTVHLSIILDNDQLDTRLIYFSIRLL